MNAAEYRNLNLMKLHLDVVHGKAGGKILWQPRIGCWFSDRQFLNAALPPPFTGMELTDIYRELGCSMRLYNMFNKCLVKKNDSRVRKKNIIISPLETEQIIETPAGIVNSLIIANTSNPGKFFKKWWITKEEDFRVFQWLEEHCTWEFDFALYEKNLGLYSDYGAPTIYLPRVNMQHLFIDLMGVEEGIYAQYDYPRTVEKYFAALSESHQRMIDVVNKCPIEIINFGDNVHCNVLPPDLFEKYVLGEYIKRNEQLHNAGKFTHAHWDGDLKNLLPYAAHCGFDGIEAATPKPQGDVTLKEIHSHFGDKLFLIDGIAALLFEDSFPLKDLEQQTREVIDLFAPNLILGISDEISSRGNLERIRFVGRIVDEYNVSREVK